MSLVHYSLDIILDLLKQLHLQRAVDNRRLSVLGFSNPDVVIHPDVVARKTGIPIDRLKLRTDARGIVNWHKAKAITHDIVDTASLFAEMGCEFHAIDATSSRGQELVHDLSTPIPKAWQNKFDIVFDIISNQCFNVAQAMANAALACRIGGYVFHQIPCQMVNQGFWNVSPTAYADYYKANGFELIRLDQIVGMYVQNLQLSLHHVRRERGVPDDTINIVIAKKLKRSTANIWPMMTKFITHPTCYLERRLEP